MTKKPIKNTPTPLRDRGFKVVYVDGCLKVVSK